MRASRPPTGATAARQLELFDDALTEPEQARGELPVTKDRLRRSNANLEAVPIEPAEPSEPAAGGPYADADRAPLAALEAALADARSAADDRAALVVLASRLGELDTPPARPPAGGLSLRQARDDWLRRLEAQQKSESAKVAYRIAIDDLLEWSEANGRNVLEEASIVDYLRSYQQRAGPAQATYYRRFLLRRKVPTVGQPTGRHPRPVPRPRPAAEAAAGARLADPRRVPTPTRRRRPARAEPARPRRARPARAARPGHDLPSSLRAVLARMAGPRARRTQAVAARPPREGRQVSTPTAAGWPRPRVAETARRSAPRADRPGLLRTRGRTPAGDDPRRHHPTRGKARRDREARHRAHAAPHRRDLPPAGARRHPPRRRVPRPRRPLDGGSLRPRRPRRALRRGAPTGTARRSSGRTGAPDELHQPSATGDGSDHPPSDSERPRRRGRRRRRRGRR